MRRCADPGLLSQWFADHRAWKARGRRTSFMYRNEDIEGYEAVRHNDVERALHRLLDRNKQSYARLKYSLIKRLIKGSVTAWGRRESPVSPPIPIPAVAWEYLVITDVRKSIVRESDLAKTKIYDVRIFPAHELECSVSKLERAKPTGVPSADKKRPSRSIKRVVTKITSRNACRDWLCALMSKSTDKKTRSKSAYWTDARSKWPDTLSERAFEKAWSDAVDVTGAIAWSAAGRIRNSPQTKSSHR